MRKFSKNGQIVFVWYGVLPFISFFSVFFLSVEPKVFFDVFVLLLSFTSVFIVLFKEKVLNPQLFYNFVLLITAFIVVWWIKEWNIFSLTAWQEEQYLATFLREIKPLVYLIAAMLYVSAYGVPNISIFVKGGVILSIIIISDVLVKYIVFGEMRRPYVSDEANYDNYLILISLIALFLGGSRKFWRILILFAAVTLLSQSKTGIATFLILLGLYFIFDKKGVAPKVIYMGIALLLMPVIFVIFQHRLEHTENFWQADRFRMISVFVDYLRNAELAQILFGQVPGASLLDYDPRLDWFIRNQSEAIGVGGLHPFNLHGFHARFISSWGALLYLGFWGAVYFMTRTSPAMKYVFMLILLQGISLGVIYISVISFIFIIFLCAIHKEYVHSATRNTISDERLLLDGKLL